MSTGIVSQCREPPSPSPPKRGDGQGFVYRLDGARGAATRGCCLHDSSYSYGMLCWNSYRGYAGWCGGEHGKDT